MENFLAALESAHNSRCAMPKYSADPVRDRLAVEHLLGNPHYYIGAGRRQVLQIQRAIRREYVKKTWSLWAFLPGFDWLSILDWITENWDTILRIILAILPFLFL